MGWTYAELEATPGYRVKQVEMALALEARVAEMNTPSDG